MQLLSTAVAFFLCLAKANAFATSGRPKASPTRVCAGLFGVTEYPPAIQKPVSLPYGEESRMYRRTVYTHDDWVKHRAPNRFVRNAYSAFSSGIYKNVAGPVNTVTFMAALVYFVNNWGKTLISRRLPHLSLPMAPFTLSSASLGLLLVFRTNTGYQRWDEARKNWGMNINRTRDLVRMGTAWYDSTGVTPERRQQDLSALALATWAFVRAMKRHLSPAQEDEAAFQEELFEKLPPEQARAIIKAKHRPNRALFDLSLAIENLPMHWLRKNEMNKALTQFEDNLGSSERLLTSPVPLFYSRHTARFLFIWKLCLPLALYGQFAPGSLMAIPVTAVLATFMFGIEELATQMEEPFTILPMQSFCDKIYNWCTEIVSWRRGDNGVLVSQSMLRHQAFDVNGLDMPNGVLNVCQ